MAICGRLGYEIGQLIESLRITLREALEFNRRDALEAAGEGFDEESIAL